jgi:hypothetical protein
MKRKTHNPESTDNQSGIRGFFHRVDRIIDAWIMNFIEQIENSISN